MAKTDFKSVAEYLSTLPKQARAKLAQVRAAIRKAVPQGEEGISYQIACLKLEGSAVLFFAGWKEHYSLYPASKQVVAAFARELAHYELRKGTIRFPLAEPVPTRLIAGIAKLRAQETRALLAERKAKRSQVSKRTLPRTKSKSAGQLAHKKSAAARKGITSRPHTKSGRRPRSGGEGRTVAPRSG
ncbi:MAG TPA: DUF1801 domain-containing protein [Polyangiaceae bacterium]|nr:DUF1801 domain-containing protein [Polyangiaceae bacterium]